jgi:hypothetical protein
MNTRRIDAGPKHGYLELEDETFYKSGPATRDYSLPPEPDQLTKDLNVAHDNIKKLVKQNDRLRETTRALRLWTKILSGAVLASWGVILTLLARILR